MRRRWMKYLSVLIPPLPLFIHAIRYWHRENFTAMTAIKALGWISLITLCLAALQLYRWEALLASWIIYYLGCALAHKMIRSDAAHFLRTSR